MNIWRFNNHLDDALRIDGDILLHNLDIPSLVSNVIKISSAYNKSIHTKLTAPKFKELCFAFFNTTGPVERELEKIWEYMAYGGTIFLSNFSERGNCGNNKAIKEFIKKHSDEITTARQMLLHGVKETNLIIKCFSKEKKPVIPLSDEKITIVTVFKTGGVYDVSYVNHIANSVKDNVTVPYEFVCLTDCFEGYNINVNRIVPFKHNFPKWWGKIELFTPQLFATDRIFYLDLDTMIVKNIDDIIRYNGDFFGLRDFYHQYGMGSGLMAWKNNNPKVFQIYERFMENPQANMNNFKYGDQEFIVSILSRDVDYVQDLYPREVVSYKKDCIGPKNIPYVPDLAKIICFHGPPRPHQVSFPEISVYWKG